MLDAALVADDVILVLELARPGGWLALSVADGAAVRWMVGDRDHRYPRR